MTTRSGKRRGLRCLVLLWVCALLCLAGVGHAAPKSFAKADTAWHKGELDVAKDLYEAALGEGGLEPREVVIAYSRIGTVKAALGDDEGALGDFRVASTIEPEFELPPDSGPQAKKVHTQARQEALERGERLTLTLTVPDSVESRQAFTVDTEIPEGFAVLVAEVIITVEDSGSGKKWVRRKAVEPALTFQIPKAAAKPGARLKLRARAVDSQNNAWAVADGKVKVEGRGGGDDGDEEAAAPSSLDSGEISPFEESGERASKEGGKDEGFFKGPMPWIVGGAAVLLTGILVFAVTRPSDQVTVGAPAWQ
jgi:hypothetical protein